MEQAIKKAIEGGWQKENRTILKFEFGHPYTFLWFTKDKKCDMEIITYKILLDPKFWEALSKAEGWGKGFTPTWNEKMHDLVDHLIEGKEIDLFFKGLLK